MMDGEKSQALLDRGTIEIAPLAYMRGRTLNDSFVILDEAQNTSAEQMKMFLTRLGFGSSFVILDEAQNTTPEQMKMFLTRLGFGSKVVVTGDVTQIDLPKGASGLKQVRTLLGGVPGIEFCDLTGKDVVRHKLVQRIVNAYSAHEERLAAAEEAKA